MKILYLSNNRFPTEKAHGLQIAKMCEAFINAGAKVLLVLPKRRQTDEVYTENAKRFYSLKHEINVRRIWNIDFLLSPLLPRIAAYGIQSFTFALSFILFGGSLPGDLIYSRTILPMIFTNKAWFFEAHTFPKSYFGKIFQKIILKNARGIICISEGLKRKYKQIYDGKILLAEDGVDLKLFSNLRGVKSKKSLILYCGSPYELKGVFTLAKATSKMKNVEIIFLGGNKNEPEFNKLKKFAKHAKVLPYVNYKIVPEFIARAEILVIPNSAKDKISNEDSSPLKLFEYMASGKKIVAADVPAIRSIIGAKEAWFFKADDSEDLQKVLKDALHSKEKRGRFAMLAAKKYSWQKRAGKIISFLTRE